MENISEFLTIAKKAAYKAGEFLKKEYSKKPEIEMMHGRDIKLKVDKISETIILDEICSHSALPFLSEESDFKGDLDDLSWVIDPLDGSSNFFRKIPVCGISIALINKKKAIVGVIYDFLNDNIYFASKDQGAFCNNKTLKVSDTSNSMKGTLMSGIPAKDSYSDQEFQNMIDDFQQWQKIRMIGSAAIANSFVASGKADCYKENGIFLWDVAAGSIIVEEAGGASIISNMDKNFRVDAVFSNGNF